MDNFTLTYYLQVYGPAGFFINGEDHFTDLATARDAAFDISLELGGDEVRVIECFGASENLVETVLA